MKKKVWTVWFMVAVVLLMWSTLNALAISSVNIVYLIIWINFGITALYGASIKD